MDLFYQEHSIIAPVSILNHILLPRLYKPRFQCMETCYTSYQAISPHHNLARYCIKAACKELEEGLHQVDCFTACSQQVSTKVWKGDWEHWAMALPGHCSREVEEKQQNKNQK